MAQKRPHSTAKLQAPRERNAIPVTPVPQSPEKKKSGFGPLHIAVIGVALVVLGVFGYLIAGSMSWSIAKENLGEAVSPRTQPKMWHAEKNATFITMNTPEELREYEQLLIENGGMKALSSENQSVIQIGLTDVLTLVTENGVAEVRIFPGKTVAWPQNGITRALPRPPAGTLVEVEQADEVSSSYTLRRVNETQARNYVANLVEKFGWIVHEDGNYLSGQGAFYVALIKDATVLLVDYYANAAGFVINIETS